MRPALRWAKVLELQADDVCECADCMVEHVNAIRLEAINAAADIVRDTGQPGCCELATRIVETLTRRP